MVYYKCRPGKWLWGIIPLALPFVGAWYLNSPIMVVKISQTAEQSLKSGGFEDLDVTMDGRDAVLAGEVQSKNAIDRAVKSVLAVHGVRRVDSSDIRIVKPVVLDIPSINPISGNNNRPELSGTWQQGVANTLSVTIGGKTYVLDTDSELTSDGKGNWKLKLTSPLVDGVHDVVVSITDSKKAAAVDDSSNEVSIDTTPPAAPVIAGKQTTTEKQPVLKGSWAHKDASSLAITLAEKEYELGKDDSLVADDKGNWTLIPSSPLADGVYDLSVKTADKAGNISATTLAGAVTIDTTAPETGSVMVLQSSDTSPIIKGKWDNAPGNILSVTVGGKKYVLGEDKTLIAEGKGNWSLILAKPLTAGKHDVTVTTTDALGNESSMTAPGVIVVDKTPPAVPQITSAVTATTTPVFKGTWEEKAGNTLKVLIDGKVFALGRDSQLTSDGAGNWTLSLTQPLKDGKYAILVESSDAFGNLARSEKPTMVVIDTSGPAKPTINKLETASKTPKLTGTWPESDKNSLSVDFKDRTYVFGRDRQLMSDGKGNWTLIPDGQFSGGFDDGSYDVEVMVRDHTGKTAIAKQPGAVVIDTQPPARPTVTTILSRNRMPLITGSWDSSDSTGLSVSVAGQEFSNKIAGQIQINGDHWSVKPSKPIADGTYDVVATATDKVGNSATDVGKAELRIDGTSPPVPTVRPVFGTSKRPPIGGTWPEDGENSLSVTLDNKSYTLNKGQGASSGILTSDGKGNWKLQLTQDLKPGSYDVKVKVADRMGNQSNDVSNGEIWIKPEAQPAPKFPVVPAKTTAPAKPVNKSVTPAETEKLKKTAIACQKEFTSLLAGQSIMFEFNKVTISTASLDLIVKLADIAKDCPSVKIEISGHTDNRGSPSFNQSLSEARASAVVDALVSRGVAKSRLRAVGYGEQQPVGDNSTKQGRAKNRRIEFKVEQ